MRRFLKSATGLSMFDGDEDRVEDVVYIQHAKDTLNIKFPKGDVGSTATVAALRSAVQDALGLSHDHSIKLVFAGQHLKDEEATLASYSVKHGSKILCMASKSRLAAPPSSSTGSMRKTPEPQKKVIIPPMEKIALVKKHVHDTILPLVVAFETSPPDEASKRRDEHHRLSETVLGEMLKLDSVDVDGPDGAEVRKKRKEMVKELHGMLERLDKVDKPSSTL